MEDWKQRATDADEKSADVVSELAEVKGELDKIAEKRMEFEGRLREVEAESGC